MRLIPGWDYDKCASLDIAVVGLSGLGAPILQLLTLMGIGEKGVTTLIDNDRIEPSNRTRIPYASPQDDGKLKVDVASQYVNAIRPERKIRALPYSVLEPEAQQAIGSSDALLGAVDSELARYIMNHCAYSFCIPYFDAGSGILVTQIEGEALVYSGGQVRIIVPGTTPCLLCNLGVDDADVDREVMRLILKNDSEEYDLLNRSGYIQGLKDAPEQPSVAHLNFFMATALVAVLLDFLLKGMPDYHALHCDMLEFSSIRSIATSRQYCPVCGEESDLIGSASILTLADFTSDLTLTPEEDDDD